MSHDCRTVHGSCKQRICDHEHHALHGHAFDDECLEHRPLAGQWQRIIVLALFSLSMGTFAANQSISWPTPQESPGDVPLDQLAQRETEKPIEYTPVTVFSTLPTPPALPEPEEEVLMEHSMEGLDWALRVYPSGRVVIEGNVDGLRRDYWGGGVRFTTAGRWSGDHCWAKDRIVSNDPHDHPVDGVIVASNLGLMDITWVSQTVGNGTVIVRQSEDQIKEGQWRVKITGPGRYKVDGVIPAESRKVWQIVADSLREC